jgi:hypothetical protein
LSPDRNSDIRENIRLYRDIGSNLSSFTLTEALLVPYLLLLSIVFDILRSEQCLHLVVMREMLLPNTFGQVDHGNLWGRCCPALLGCDIIREALD